MNSSEQRRTVVVSGVPDALPPSRMADKLVIHFQRSKNLGGDVQHVQYPTNIKGVAFVTFDGIQDAENVLKTDHVLKDKEFPDAYPVTVFRFSEGVFLFLRAEVDLSMFGDPYGLIQHLKKNHRSVRFSLLPFKTTAVVEGPFKAMKVLREDLRTRMQSTGYWSGESGAGRCLVSVVGGLQEESTWVDTNVFKYIRNFQRRKLDQCFQKYAVEIKIQEQGDLTQIVLSGADHSFIMSARSDLELLVATLMSDLRTQKIDYSSLDRRQRERLLGFCKDANLQHPDVLFVPLKTCIEVIGPSASSYDFCKEVEGMMCDAKKQPF
ncbi:RNA-binding protein 43 [Brienomyrus brachyistius]|uniref:RNA-binding protein 43 n=1 Tax=Brienomyrus brachyistius TaxID=42636 RepID=UPI0020B1A869|nr:RNA-binding protein 43 [Brienomyrus brachyistius]